MSPLRIGVLAAALARGPRGAFTARGAGRILGGELGRGGLEMARGKRSAGGRAQGGAPRGAPFLAALLDADLWFLALPDLPVLPAGAGAASRHQLDRAVEADLAERERFLPWSYPEASGETLPLFRRRDRLERFLVLRERRSGRADPFELLECRGAHLLPFLAAADRVVLDPGSRHERPLDEAERDLLRAVVAGLEGEDEARSGPP